MASSTILLPALLLWAGQGNPVPHRDVGRMMDQARQVQMADLEFWGRLTFRRQVIRERLDGAGQVLEREELVFRIRPSPRGFDEELRFIDGQMPTRRQVREHRAAGRFNERYQTAVSGEDPRYDKGDFSLANLLRRSDYLYLGVETIDGIPCHRLRFTAHPEVGGMSVEERMAAATEGSLWLAEGSLHMVRAETRTIRSVAALAGLVKVEEVAILLETDALGKHRVPRLIDVRSDLVIAGKRVHKHNRFRYSEFSRLPAAPLPTRNELR